MIIYNVTINIDSNLAEEWLQWLLNEHIPEIMHTGYFSDYRVSRLLGLEEGEGPTYSIQYFVSTQEQYDKYLHQYASIHNKKAHEKWGSGFVAFHSLMEVVK